MLNLSFLGTFQTGLECPTTAGGTVDAATSASANRFVARRHASLISAAARETHEQVPHVGRDCASGVARTRKPRRSRRRVLPRSRSVDAAVFALDIAIDQY